VVGVSSAKIYGLLLSMAVLFVTARWLGPAGRGEVAAVLTWATVFSGVFHLSLGQVALHRSSGKGTEEFDETFALLGCSFIILTLLGWGVATLIGVFWREPFGSISNASLILGLGILFPLALWDQYANALIMILDRLDIHNWALVTSRSLMLLLTGALVIGLGSGVLGALVSIVAGNCLLVVLEIYWLRQRMGRMRIFVPRGLASFLKDGMKLHLNAIGALLFTSSDVLMLNYFRGSAETGWYQLGVQLIGVIMIVPQAASMVIYGKLAKEGVDDVWRKYHKSLLKKVLMLVVGMAVLIGISAGWWIPILAGDDFLPAKGVLQWLLLAAVGMTFTILMAPQWIGRGFFWQASLLTLAVGLANLIANYLLIPTYGMYGAVWATIGVYLIAIIGNGAMGIFCELSSRRGSR